MIIVIGIDPGFAHCGFAEHWSHPISGCPPWVAQEYKSAPGASFNARLQALRAWLSARLVYDYRTHVVVGIEEQSQVVVGKTRAGKTDLNSLRVQQVVGLLKGLAWASGFEVVEVSPGAAKLALAGSAVATKRQMRAAARRRLGRFPSGRLPSEHEADAIGVALAAEGKLRLDAAVTRSKARR